jgi:hypothetical protein
MAAFTRRGRIVVTVPKRELRLRARPPPLPVTGPQSDCGPRSRDRGPVPAAPGQRGENLAFAFDHGTQLLAVGMPARRPQLVLDGMQSEQQFTNGAGIGIAHDSLGKLEEFGARTV